MVKALQLQYIEMTHIIRRGKVREVQEKQVVESNNRDVRLSVQGVSVMS